MKKCKTILIIVGGTSSRNASFNIARHLRRRGHSIIYLAPHWERESIEKQGFYFQTFEMANVEDGKKRLNRLQHFRKQTRQLFIVRDWINDSAKRWLLTVNPDLALLDANLLKYAMPLLESNIPIIHLNSTLSYFYGAGTPPIFSCISPSKRSGQYSFFNKIKGEVAWFRILKKQFIETTNAMLSFLIAFGGRRFKTTPELIRAFGAQLKKTEYGLRLSAPEIVLGPAAFDFPISKVTEKRIYAGFCVDNERNEPFFDFDSLDGRPIIYCSMGTHSGFYVHLRRLFKCVIECMNTLKDYQLILQTDVLFSSDMMNDVPENVSVFSNAPQLSILKCAKIFITHGGFSSVREAIYFGTPMVVFPGWHDQSGNAARVVYHNLGVRGRMKTITTDSLLAMIREVLTSVSIKDAVLKIRAAIHNNTGLEEAIRFIEDFK